MSRRKFLKIAGTVVGGAALLTLGRVGTKLEATECGEWQDQIEDEKPGYEIEDLGGGVKRIELRETGEVKDNACPAGWPPAREPSWKRTLYSKLAGDERFEEIRNVTYAEAVNEIGSSCDVVSTTPLVQDGDTTSLLVHTKNCK